MKAEFSEFSYGFAVTNELISWIGTNLTAAPYFPSLTDEGSLGYDLRLERPGIPLFIQFKRSERIEVLFNRVREKKEGIFDSPFYRMHIRERRISRQHEILCDLEESGSEVYYVAPLFIYQSQFNKMFLNNEICQRSIFIRPLAIGRLNDYEKHHVSFQNTNEGYRFSTPTRLNGSFGIEAMGKNVTRKLEQQLSQHKFGKDSWVELNHNLERVLKQTKYWFSWQSVSDEDLEKRKNPLERIAFLSQTVLGCQFYIANFKGQITDESQIVTQQNPLGSRLR